MSTLAELRFRVRELAGLSDTEFDTSPGDIDRFLNVAQRHWLERHDWPWLHDELEVQTTVDESDYAPNVGDVARIYGAWVRDENTYYRLRPRARDTFYTASEPGTGLPREYVVLDDMAIRLYPVPDAAYEIIVGVSLDPGLMAEDGDVTPIPEPYADGLALIGASRVLRRRRADGDVGRANDMDEEAAALLEGMRRRYMVDHDPSQSVLGGRHERVRRGTFPNTAGPRWL